MKVIVRCLIAWLAGVVLVEHTSRAAEPPSFERVAAIFAEHCLDCHAVQDPEGKLVLETYELFLKGGETGPAFVAAKPDESLLIRMVEAKYEKNGKTVVMPPGRRKKLSQEEIGLLRAWIEGGAQGPTEPALAKVIEAPKIEPKVPPKASIHALAYHEKEGLLAVARLGSVQIWSVEEQRVVRTMEDSTGTWNAVAFSRQGTDLFVAGGESGISGEVRQYNASNGKHIRTFSGHSDSLYAVAVSPDGKILATGGYDQKIKLWSIETGAELRTLSGHNGCIYGLDFRADGKILASASGDRTVKLWDVATGERRDTFSQSLKELYTVSFNPDGKRVAAAGVDNRIRIWEVSDEANETTNPILISKFAHDSPILRIVFSPDGKLIASSAEDRTVKIWEADSVREKLLLENQPDWAPGITFALQGKGLVAGRLDGSLAFYDASKGSHLPLPKPELASIHPRGVQRGIGSKIKLTGKFLMAASSVKTSHEKIAAEFLEEERTSTTAWVRITPAADLPRGQYDIRIVSGAGESGTLKLHVDDLPVAQESNSPQRLTLPVTVWGLQGKSGEIDRYEFEAKAGQTIVFDGAAKSIGSKADLVLTLSDAHGRVLASNNRFEQSADPFLAYKFEEEGNYFLTVSELLLGASAEHFYRISMGELPFALATYPSIVAAGAESSVTLLGYNLPEPATVVVPASKSGEVAVPLDENKFRSRNALKVAVTERPLAVETEPNNDWLSASTVSVPVIIAGRSDKSGDEDWFRFNARAGETWILETAAARRGSPMDTKIEVLDHQGKPITRVLLQAVRDSAITFRGIDSNTIDCRVDNWEEMELNQYLYIQGEVVKLFRMPQGPDSGFNFYSLNGKRRNYFDTSATAHANEEPCYIVEPHPPGTKLVPNGLPSFPIYFVNDDDADRKLGTDSKLTFTAPSDGTYHVRVTDTRSFGGERFNYELSIRPAAPDFRVTLNGANPKVASGSGQSFSVAAERIDGFEGEIEVEISNLPSGFTVSSPLVIQAGHTTAQGTIHAAPSTTNISDEEAAASKVIARAVINGKTVTREVNSLGRISLAESVPVYVTFEPGGEAHEIIIAPGQTVPAWIKVLRAGHEELLTFSVDNLPHGIIVDNIGLNGVLIPKGQNEREVFITAAKWVPETERLCYAVCNEAGRQTSLPVWMKVRGPESAKVARK